MSLHTLHLHLACIEDKGLIAKISLYRSLAFAEEQSRAPERRPAAVLLKWIDIHAKHKSGSYMLGSCQESARAGTGI